MYKNYDELPGVLTVKELKDFLGIPKSLIVTVLPAADALTKNSGMKSTIKTKQQTVR